MKGILTTNFTCPWGWGGGKKNVLKIPLIMGRTKMGKKREKYYFKGFILREGGESKRRWELEVMVREAVSFGEGIPVNRINNNKL